MSGAASASAPSGLTVELISFSPAPAGSGDGAPRGLAIAQTTLR